MVRSEMLNRVEAADEPWDVLVIGGGATGLGVAVDASSRGYRTVLVEQADFAKGTSSRSTKLVHGGVRYLQQGNISLVLEALRERGILHKNAPHVVGNLSFVVPIYDWWEGPFYGVGLKLYDTMAGKQGLGRSKWLSKAETQRQIPTVRAEGLRGGVRYFDGQFDDARLAIDLAHTASDLGAVVLNYAQVTSLDTAHGMVAGAVVRDVIGEKEYRITARVVINATGPFCDAVRKMDDPAAAPMIKPSRGVHIVLDRSFLPRESAIMVPHTSDGRVLFSIPWHDRVLVGTTDTAVETADLEPRAGSDDIAFLLENVSRYLTGDPSERDVLSVFAGIRPLVDFGNHDGTASISREHTIHISGSGLITVAGGKWTTYRKMAEETVDQAQEIGNLAEAPSRTMHLPIHGADGASGAGADFAVYGSDGRRIEEIVRSRASYAERVHPDLPVLVGEAVWAARAEMAQGVEDFLARRTRCLLLDARKSVEAAKVVAEVLAEELGRDRTWQDREVERYAALARSYLPR